MECTGPYNFFQKLVTFSLLPKKYRGANINVKQFFMTVWDAMLQRLKKEYGDAAIIHIKFYKYFGSLFNKKSKIKVLQRTASFRTEQKIFKWRKIDQKAVMNFRNKRNSFGGTHKKILLLTQILKNLTSLIYNSCNSSRKWSFYSLDYAQMEKILTISIHLRINKFLPA